MEATKSVLRQDLCKKLEEALEADSKMLVQHWCSDECQERIKTYLNEQIQ